MWTPKTKWQTCWPKATSRGMSGSIFCTCSTSCIFRHLLAATSFFQTESRALWCRKDPKKVGRFTDSEGKAKTKSDESCVASKPVHCETEFSLSKKKKTNDFEFPVSDRTDMMLASFGEPSQKSADHLSLHSQERPQGITSSRTLWQQCEFLWHRETVARNVESREFTNFRTGIRVFLLLWETGAEITDTGKENQTRIS